MFKKTIMGVTAAAAITVAALSGTTTTAQAGGVYFGFGGHGGYGATFYGGGHGYYRNPCRHWKRKWRRTGRYYYLRRYCRCMNHYY